MSRAITIVLVIIIVVVAISLLPNSDRLHVQDEGLGYDGPTAEAETVTPISVEKPAKPYVQTEEEILLEGKHKPIEEMTDQERTMYYDNRVVGFDSPDIRPNLNGNPYEVIQYLMKAAKREDTRACRQCFSSSIDKAARGEEIDQLESWLHHEKKSYRIEYQEYATGNTHFELDKYMGKDRCEIEVMIHGTGFTAKDFTLVRTRNRWRILKVETSCG